LKIRKEVGMIITTREKVLNDVSVVLSVAGLTLEELISNAHSAAVEAASHALKLKHQAEQDMSKAEGVLLKEVKKAETAFGATVKVARKKFTPVAEKAEQQIAESDNVLYKVSTIVSAASRLV